MIDDFKVGQVPEVTERFTIERIVEDITLEIFFSTVVGTRSIVMITYYEIVNFRFQVR